MAGNTDIFSPDFDANGLVDTAIANGQKAEQDTTWQKVYDKQAQDDMFPGDTPEKAWEWISSLPKNITVGTLNAALATVGLLHDTKTALDHRAAKRDQARADTGGKPLYSDELRQQLLGDRPYIVPDSVRVPVTKWRDQVVQNNTVADDLTQGIAQFVVPFTLFSKLANTSSAASLLEKAAKLGAAEAATVATSYEPHDARGADLLELARQSESKFGEVMRAASPDGSLLNAYINYMTDRQDEGPWEGRYKNVVDSLGLTAATAGLIKAVPFSIKAGRYAVENAFTGPAFGSKAAQRGWIGYHGSPHDFERFDVSKIGVGEGNQNFGHGLYFAENPGVARSYLMAGRNEGFANWDSAPVLAQKALALSKGDRKQAVALLQERLGKTKGEISKSNLQFALQSVESGKADSGMYTVEIPDEVVGNMLLWDEPLASQPKVLAALGLKADQAVPQIGGTYGELSGQQLYSLLKSGRTNLGAGTTAEEASAFLDKHGVPGIRYLDSGSRGKENATRNLVLFDDKHVTIKGKE